MELTEIIRCRGHENILGRHKSTFEVTTETELSLQGDCIIGVGADKGSTGLSPEFRDALRHPEAILTTVLEAGGIRETVVSRGNSGAPLTNPSDLVWRKSTFVCGRTVGTGSDKAARDLSHDLITVLKTGAELTVTMTVRIPDE